MSKSIFIVDTPRNCYECPLCVCDTEYDTLCSALTIKAKDDYTNDVYEIVTDEEWTAERYSKCPLKPIPNKKNKKDIAILGETKEILNGRYEGWNDCIDKILGEKE